MLKVFTVHIDGEPFTSTAPMIVDRLRYSSFMLSNKSIGDFIQEVQHNIWKIHHIGIQVDKNSLQVHQCQQLVEQLIEHKLLPSS